MVAALPSAAGPRLTVTSFTPAEGFARTTLSISGTGFLSASRVAFNGTAAGFAVQSDTQISTSVPAGATSGPIAVTVGRATVNSRSSFTVTPGPVIEWFSPTAGPARTAVTITGSDFLGAGEVLFNGEAAAFAVDSDTQITASVPAGTTTGPIQVVVGTQTAISPEAFRLTAVAPVTPAVDGFSPAVGPEATIVTIRGSGLAGATDVRFHGTSAAFTVQDDATITATVPRLVTSGPITVSTLGGTATSAAPFTATPSDPNIVLILTDDQRFDELGHMPAVRRSLAARGVRFTNGFVVNPLCCPSRTTMLTGRYSHGTDVYYDRPPHGGFVTFRSRGEEQSTIATLLSGRGYRTALIGKYLNGYTRPYTAKIPPGWDDWVAFTQPEETSLYYRYTLSVNGRGVAYGSREGAYSTDVLARYASDFIASVPPEQPLFLWFAPRAPHAPTTPPPRYEHACPGLAPLRPPSFNEKDVSDKPGYIRSLGTLSRTRTEAIDARRRRACQALLAVDDAVDRILKELARAHRLDNTLILFSSDNGLLDGEHRWDGKDVPYEESIRVPVVIRYDPLTGPVQGRDDSHLVLNLDFAATFANAAGLQMPGSEGMSLLPLLAHPATPWRSDFLIEHRGGPVPMYCGVRDSSHVYVQYATGWEELYDLQGDPHQMRNVAADASRAQLKQVLRDRMVNLCDPPPPGYQPRPSGGVATEGTERPILSTIR